MRKKKTVLANISIFAMLVLGVELFCFYKLGMPDKEQKNFEKYNVVIGNRAIPDRYPDQEGFGWTNAVYLRFVDFLDRNRPLEELAP
jgi:hypothetical protein